MKIYQTFWNIFLKENTFLKLSKRQKRKEIVKTFTFTIALGVIWGLQGYEKVIPVKIYQTFWNIFLKENTFLKLSKRQKRKEIVKTFTFTIALGVIWGLQGYKKVIPVKIYQTFWNIFLKENTFLKLSKRQKRKEIVNTFTFTIALGVIWGLQGYEKVIPVKIYQTFWNFFLVRNTFLELQKVQKGRNSKKNFDEN